MRLLATALATGVALALGACSAEQDATSSEPASGGGAFVADLEPLNDSGVNGRVQLVLDGDRLDVDITANGLAPGQAHPQLIAGRSDDAESRCPTIDADDDGDGLVEPAEAQAAYGQGGIALRPYPQARGGDVDTARAYEIDSDIQPLDDRVVVIKGAMVGNDYDPDVPVACGALQAAAESPEVTAQRTVQQTVQRTVTEESETRQVQATERAEATETVTVTEAARREASATATVDGATATATASANAEAEAKATWTAAATATARGSSEADARQEARRAAEKRAQERARERAQERAEEEARRKAAREAQQRAEEEARDAAREKAREKARERDSTQTQTTTTQTTTTDTTSTSSG